MRTPPPGMVPNDYYSPDEVLKLTQERDDKTARLEQTLDRVRAAADTLAECEAFDHDFHDTYHEGKRDAYDLAEQLVREALDGKETSE